MGIPSRELIKNLDQTNQIFDFDCGGIFLYKYGFYFFGLETFRVPAKISLDLRLYVILFPENLRLNF